MTFKYARPSAVRFDFNVSWVVADVNLVRAGIDALEAILRSDDVKLVAGSFDRCELEDQYWCGTGVRHVDSIVPGTD